MFSAAAAPSLVFALSYFCSVASGRAVWPPEESSPLEELSLSASLITRDTSICGGDATLTQCGSSFPSEFCCPASSACLALNTTSSVVAAICCPIGVQCTVINTVSCDQKQQNATIVPQSGLHSDPVQALDTCGEGCCPMGYSCDSNQCVVQALATGITSSSASASPTAVATSSASSTTTTSTSPSAVTIPFGTGATGTSKPASSFSGGSFAAGFVPGIAIGAFIAACILLILFRKRRTSPSYIDEKPGKHDTLTDLGPLSRRPTFHGRSISEPAIDPAAGHRTDFLRTTPPRPPRFDMNEDSYSVEVQGPIPSRSPKLKAMFSHSPFMQTPSTPPLTQPPMPAHLKRGTLNFNISPIRALKKQKSMHSLRRQMTDASRRGASRSNSQETIQILMSDADPYTPDQRPSRQTDRALTTLGSSTYQPPWSGSSSWQTASNAAVSASPPPASSRYPTYTNTPTRALGVAAPSGMLGTPYSPSSFPISSKGKVTNVLVADDGLRVVREPQRRDTTFSTMMERAGLRRSELIMSSGH